MISQVADVDLDVVGVGRGGVQLGGAFPGFFAAGGQVAVIDHELLDDVAGGHDGLEADVLVFATPVPGLVLFAVVVFVFAALDLLAADVDVFHGFVPAFPASAAVVEEDHGGPVVGADGAAGDVGGAESGRRPDVVEQRHGFLDDGVGERAEVLHADDTDHEVPGAGAAVVGAGRAVVVAGESAALAVALRHEAFFQLFEGVVGAFELEVAELGGAQCHDAEGHAEEVGAGGAVAVAAGAPLGDEEAVDHFFQGTGGDGFEVGVQGHAVGFGEGVGGHGVVPGLAHEEFDAALHGRPEFGGGAGDFAVREVGEDGEAGATGAFALAVPAAVGALLGFEPAEGAHDGVFGVAVAAETAEGLAARAGGAGGAVDVFEDDGAFDGHHGVEGLGLGGCRAGAGGGRGEGDAFGGEAGDVGGDVGLEVGEVFGRRLGVVGRRDVVQLRDLLGFGELGFDDAVAGGGTVGHAGHEPDGREGDADGGERREEALQLDARLFVFACAAGRAEPVQQDAGAGEGGAFRVSLWGDIRCARKASTENGVPFGQNSGSSPPL